MAKSHTRIYIHYIWATKNHQRILVKNIRQKVKEHIRGYCQKEELENFYQGYGLDTKEIDW